MEEILGEALANPLNSCISFKGTREGLHISLGEGAWQDLLKELAVQLDRPGVQSFFRGARVLLETGNRAIGVSELEELIGMLAERQMTLSTVLDDPEAQNALAKMQASAEGQAVPSAAPQAAASEAPPAAAASEASPPAATEGPAAAPSEGAPAAASEGAAVDSTASATKSSAESGSAAGVEHTPGSSPPAEPTPAADPSAAAGATPEDQVPGPGADKETKTTALPPPPEYLPMEHPRNVTPPVSFDDSESKNDSSPALIFRRSVRSGQTLKHKGTIVILGDVHPGAVVIAEGDVFVWGRLRGLVHAGAAGNNSATVSALTLAPTQLRIGTHIARAPDQRTQHTSPAEIARVRGNQIVLEPWNGGRI